MRYYGPISRGHVTFLIACALSLSVALNLPASMTFVAHWGTVLSELQSRQAEAKLAAFEYYVADAVGHEARLLVAEPQTEK